MHVGDLSNAQLLYTYGFVEEDNPFDNLLIPVDLVCQLCKSYMNENEEGEGGNNNSNDSSNNAKAIEVRKDVLESAGILPDITFIIHKEDMLPDNLFTTLRGNNNCTRIG